MNIKAILGLYFVSVPFFSIAQKAEKIQQVFLYDFTYHYDSTDYSNMQKEVMELDLAKNMSFFYSKDGKELDSTIKSESERMAQAGKSFTDFSLFARKMATSVELFYTDLTNSKVYDQKEFENQVYLLQNNTSVIDWKILDSTKKIGDYLCQKAEGNSSGRDYIVWFTSDLPYSFGPRRLFGLPGIILEAKDKQNRIFYTFKGLGNVVENAKISIPSKATKTDYTSYNKMVDATEKMYSNGFKKKEVRTIINDKGQSQTVTTITSGGRPSRPNEKNPYNFPMDLTHK